MIRGPTPERLLRLLNGQTSPERLLPDGAADRTGEIPGLNAGDAKRRLMVIGAPQALLWRDAQVQTGVLYVIRCRAGRARTPRRQVVRQPRRKVQLWPVKVVLEHQAKPGWRFDHDDTPCQIRPDAERRAELSQFDDLPDHIAAVRALDAIIRRTSYARSIPRLATTGASVPERSRSSSWSR